MSKALSTPSPSPMKKPLPPALAANVWKPGQSGNPGGKGGTFYEMMRLARQFTPEATQILIDIVRDPSEDSRNKIVAIGMLYERAWGKPKEFDPNSQEKPPLDFSKLSPQGLALLRQLLAPVIGDVVEHESGKRDSEEVREER